MVKLQQSKRKGVIIYNKGNLTNEGKKQLFEESETALSQNDPKKYLRSEFPNLPLVILKAFLMIAKAQRETSSKTTETKNFFIQNDQLTPKGIERIKTIAQKENSGSGIVDRILEKIGLSKKELSTVSEFREKLYKSVTAHIAVARRQKK